MKRFITVGVLALLSSLSTLRACLDPHLDDKAVQWATAVVQARFVSVGPRVELGQIQEREGFAGALGRSTTTYAYRLYDFEVTETLDGPLKKGDKFQVVRLFSRYEPPAALGCSQHLTQEGIGKEFLLLLRPLGEFHAILPNGIKKPDVPGAMYIVHLEPKDELKSDAMTDLLTRIIDARSGAQGATPARIQQQIEAVKKARSDAQAKPAITALERMGPKVIPDVQAAADSASGHALDRLNQVLNDLTILEPITMIEKEPANPDERGRR